MIGCQVSRGAAGRGGRSVLRPGAAIASLAALLLVCACSGPRNAAAPATDSGINKVGATVFAVSGRTELPALKGPTIAGGTLDLASLRGHIVVLNVWASWCVPCKAESPALAQVARSTATEGVRFVGIDENDQDAPAKAFLAGIKSDYPNLADPEGQLLAQLRMLPPAVPGSLVLDREGRVAARVIGPTTAAQMSALIAQVLSTT
jgi:thiol-disulfide isomerase/thioredoxin